MQRGRVGEPVKDLVVRLVPPEGEGIDHHERKIASGRDAGIRRGDRDGWRGGHLFHGKVLTWRDGAYAGEGNSQEGGGVKGRKKIGDEAGILEIGLNIKDGRGGTTDGLGIGEEAEEGKSKCGRKKHRECGFSADVVDAATGLDL